jgi:SAM-dependent methyltransferase
MPERGDVPAFEEVTETTGTAVTPEGAQMIYSRYQYAASRAAGKVVLEIACGSGQGLGLVSAVARRVVAGDINEILLARAQRHYGSRVPLARFSADALPFADTSFDLVLFFEASYYVPDMAVAFAEVGRVVRGDGAVVFVNANPERPDFVRSPHAVQYHAGDAFRAALEALGFAVTVEGVFAVVAQSRSPAARFMSHTISVVRRAAERLGLIPKTLAGRARLKRLIYRKLETVPPELPPAFASAAPRVVVPPGPVRGFKVLYVTATRLRA